MADHLNREQMVKYRDRELPPAEMVAADDHLSCCAECRTAVGSLSSALGSGWMGGIASARGEHVSYEQMDAWVEDQLDRTERELVRAHVAWCDPCARQLRAYESYAPAMSVQIPPPAQEATTWADRARAFFRTPQFAVIAAAALVVLVLSPVAIRQSGRPSTVSSFEPARPQALGDLPANSDSVLLYPVSEAIEEQQPIFEWRQGTGPVQVFIFDAMHQDIAHSDPISGAEWLAPVPLGRGAVYSWEVRAAVAGGPNKHEASFRVLSQADHEKLAAARTANEPPSQIGDLARSLGALSEAQRQFRSEIRRNPSDSGAKEQLNQILQMRGR